MGCPLLVSVAYCPVPTSSLSSSKLKLRWDAQLPAVESRGRDLAEGFLSSATGEASGSASPHLSGCSRGLGSTHSRRLS